jgi:hypothetical protein
MKECIFGHRDAYSAGNFCRILPMNAFFAGSDCKKWACVPGEKTVVVDNGTDKD